MLPALIAVVVVVLFVIAVVARTIKVIPQARAGVVERLGRYRTHAGARPRTSSSRSSTGVAPLIDLREQVVSFEPQPVITEDNLVVLDRHRSSSSRSPTPKAADYEIADYIRGDRAAHRDDAAQRDRRHGRWRRR